MAPRLATHVENVSPMLRALPRSDRPQLLDRKRPSTLRQRPRARALNGSPGSLRAVAARRRVAARALQGPARAAASTASVSAPIFGRIGTTTDAATARQRGSTSSQRSRRAAGSLSTPAADSAGRALALSHAWGRGGERPERPLSPSRRPRQRRRVSEARLCKGGGGGGGNTLRAAPSARHGAASSADDASPRSAALHNALDLNTGDDENIAWA